MRSQTYLVNWFWFKLRHLTEHPEIQIIEHSGQLDSRDSQTLLFPLPSITKKQIYYVIISDTASNSCAQNIFSTTNTGRKIWFPAKR